MNKSIKDQNKEVKKRKKLLFQASGKFSRRDFQGAIKDYSKYIELFSKPYLGFVYRSLCKMKVEDYKGAKIDILEAIKLDPANGKAYEIWLELLLLKEGNIKEILEIYKKCLELSEFNSYLGFYKDNTPLLDKELNIWTNAINDIQKYTLQISINEEIGNSHFQRGISKQKLFNFKNVIPFLSISLIKQVIEDFTKTIELNFRKADSYFQRGISKSLLAQEEEAIKDITIAIELNPKNDEYFARRGECQYLSKKYKEAIKDITIAIELNPKNDEYFAMRGELKSSLKKYKEAIEDYSKAIELNPKCKTCFLSRGACKQFSKKYKEAIEDFTIYIDSQDCEINLLEAFGRIEFNKGGGMVGAYLGRGICYRELKDYFKAIDDFTNAIELHPEGFIYSSRGTAKFLIKDYEGALEDFLTYKNYEISDEEKKVTNKRILLCKEKLLEIDDILKI